MNERKLLIENGADNQDWPEPVKRKFLELCFLADQHDFSVLCAVGFNRTQARGGDIKLEAFFSPLASKNPHRTEMLDDMVVLFQRAKERGIQ